MNSKENEKRKLVDNIVEGLKQKPAYLLLFGILVLFMLIVSTFAVVMRDHTAVVIGSFVVVILISLFIAAYVIKVVEGNKPEPIPQKDREVMEKFLPLGTPEDVPLSKEEANRWAKKWNCRWTYMSESGQLLPYVDDNITIHLDRIDRDTGYVRCWDESPYRRGTTKFKLFGRISKRNMALMFYAGYEDFMDFIGVIILRMQTSGVYGWWLGVGKDNTDVGGQFTWKDASMDPDFRPREYDLSKDPPKRMSFLY